MIEEAINFFYFFCQRMQGMAGCKAKVDHGKANHHLIIAWNSWMFVGQQAS
jgi:hypothetical protein